MDHAEALLELKKIAHTVDGWVTAIYDAHQQSVIAGAWIDRRNDGDFGRVFDPLSRIERRQADVLDDCIQSIAGIELAVGDAFVHRNRVAERKGGRAEDYAANARLRRRRPAEKRNSNRYRKHSSILPSHQSHLHGASPLVRTD